MFRRGARTPIALAICCALVALAPALACAAPMTVATFQGKVVAALEAVRVAGSAVESQTVAAELASQVEMLLPLGLEVAEQTSTVTIADNELVHLLTGRLRDAGTASARIDAAEALTQHLESMRNALGASAETPWDAAALDRLVVDRPVTADNGDNWLNDRITELLDRIARWLDGLNGSSDSALPYAPSRLITYAVVAVPIAAALWVLVRALRKRRRRSHAEAPGVAEPGGPVVAAAADLPADPLAFADVLAAEGRHRDAVRALYGGAARRLVETGVVVHVRTRTNHEMLRDVRAASPDIAPGFALLTDEFERAWYGHAEPGEDGFQHARVTYAGLLGVVSANTSAADEPGVAGGEAL